MLEIVGLVAVVVLILVGLVALGGHIANRSWSDEEYEHEQRRGSALGNAFLTVQSLFDSGAQYALEQRTSEEADDQASGGKPDPSSGRLRK